MLEVPETETSETDLSSASFIISSAAAVDFRSACYTDNVISSGSMLSLLTDLRALNFFDPSYKVL